MRLVSIRIRESASAGIDYLALSALLLVLIMAWPATGLAARCDREGGYDRSEIAGSVFFSTREQTKFAPSEPHYPLASGASARYCFSRGCSGQLTVRWSDDEQRRLHRLRDALVTTDDAQAELHFIKVAVLQMETWLYTRLRRLDKSSVNNIMTKISRHYGKDSSDDMHWVSRALSTFDRFDKECATYAMEATQHLLVLANLGLLKHWNVTAPVYRYGIPGHWTAGLENRQTCQRYRFDLNSRASMRHELHVKGSDPAALSLDDTRHSFLFPGMDGAGRGHPTEHRRPELPAGGFALNGPQHPAATSPARR